MRNVNGNNRIGVLALLADLRVRREHGATSRRPTPWLIARMPACRRIYGTTTAAMLAASKKALMLGDFRQAVAVAKEGEALARLRLAGDQRAEPPGGIWKSVESFTLRCVETGITICCRDGLTSAGAATVPQACARRSPTVTRALTIGASSGCAHPAHHRTHAQLRPAFASRSVNSASDRCGASAASGRTRRALRHPARQCRCCCLGRIELRKVRGSRLAALRIWRHSGLLDAEPGRAGRVVAARRRRPWAGAAVFPHAAGAPTWSTPTRSASRR